MDDETLADAREAKANLYAQQQRIADVAARHPDTWGDYDKILAWTVLSVLSGLLLEKRV